MTIKRKQREGGDGRGQRSIAALVTESLPCSVHRLENIRMELVEAVKKKDAQYLKDIDADYIA